jgi:dimethylargininase
VLIALTREISSAITRCELTHLQRESIDLAFARAQHAEYEKCLAEAGCRVTRLPAPTDMPDCVFIEDAAVVLPEVAIIMRPGAVSRRGETVAVAEALRPYRTLAQIEAPGTIDGGDVLVAGRRVFVGISSRTNHDAVRQLRAILASHGYTVEEVEVRCCLHLKSAVTLIGENLLLVNPAWLPPEPFASFDRVEVAPQEPMAANALLVGGHVIVAAPYPRTRERIERHGLAAGSKLRTVDVSELAKAEGALTCCSLIFESPHS